MEPAGDITQILRRVSGGEPQALNELLPLIYDELRQIAKNHMKRERGGHTLQTTALVHEAYLRLIGQNQVEWEGSYILRELRSSMPLRLRRDFASYSELNARACCAAYAFSEPLPHARKCSSQNCWRSVRVECVDVVCSLSGERYDANQSSRTEVRRSWSAYTTSRSIVQKFSLPLISYSPQIRRR